VARHLGLFGDKIPADAEARSYRAEEGISLPYAIDVVFSTADATFRAADCLQRRVLLEVEDPQGNVRHYDGLPDQGGFVAHDGDAFSFRLRLRPALAALEHREGSRIFQGESPVDVVKAMLENAGVDRDVEWRLRRTYAPREVLCQYRERDLDFVHRVLGEEGIFYFFLHSAEGHKLVFADDPAAFVTPDGARPVTLAARQGGAPGTMPLAAFSRTKTLRPTEVHLRDYDFEKPAVPPTAVIPAPGKWPLRHYLYPAGFKADAEGARKAARHLSALRADMDTCRGESGAAGLVCGAPMTVEGADEPFLNGDFVVTELRSRGEAGGDACANTFVAIPKDAPFAVPQRVPKPRIHGVQTAIVVGPTNEPEAIHVDKYGRIKVRFLWDRSGKQDDGASFWIRSAQLGLGGSMILPRVGWEVAVAFLDGDPDRPLVLGRTYNAEHTPPDALPGAAADGSLKSKSTPGGAGHNQIKMGDSAGKQGMSISAQKDLNASTGNDKNETIAVDEDHAVGANYKITIGADEVSAIGGNQSIDVGNALQVKVLGAQTVSVGGSEEAHAKADFVEKVGGTRDYAVGGSQITISNGVRQQITGAFSRDVGAVELRMSLGSIHDNMMATYDEKAGAAIIHLVKGTSAEDVAAGKTQTSAAAELHLVSALSTQAKSVKQLVGGLHLRKVAGDYVVQASTIILAGGIGKFNGGGSSVSLDAGPVTLSGAKIAIQAGIILKQAGDLKIG
jgi:type VI secretion system secreted protein VgrG